MKANRVIALLVVLLMLRLFYGAMAQQQPPASPQQPAGNQTSQGPSPGHQFVDPRQVNVLVGNDLRLFTIMAALNLAGYNYEVEGRAPSPLRASLKEKFARVDPAIIARLRQYYQSHRAPGLDEPSQVAKYIALAFVVNPPPSFSLTVAREKLPEDVRSIVDFIPLIQEFYAGAGLRSLIPTIAPSYNSVSTAYRQATGEAIFQILSYLHTTPVTFIPAPLIPVQSQEKDKQKKSDKDKKEEEGPAFIPRGRDRVRRMFVVPDLLNAQNTAYFRNDIVVNLENEEGGLPGDDYLVVVGPTPSSDIKEIRRAFIRFVMDPIIDKNLQAVVNPRTKQRTELGEAIVKLVQQLPKATNELKQSLPLIIRESFTYAVEAGMARSAAAPAELQQVEEDNLYNLSIYYERGAVLAFHFYQALKGLESTGIDVSSLFASFLSNTDIARESTRSAGFAELRARVEKRRAEQRAQAVKASLPGVDEHVAARLVQADKLIQQRRFEEARIILMGVLNEQPRNARAIFGLAQIVNQAITPVEADEKADPDDKLVAQEERLGQAVLLYRQAIEAASPETEKWIISRSYVAIGRIFDFRNLREDAIAEYEKAIELGRVPNGAYDQAIEGKKKPFGQQ